MQTKVVQRIVGGLKSSGVVFLFCCGFPAAFTRSDMRGSKSLQMIQENEGWQIQYKPIRWGQKQTFSMLGAFC